ncbi:hypothetical protein LSM04_002556 [Trypanosoma melophagium]|uniref:uncharacterized protein n=1 Tax=Trypanosoma melophagium TaxID=715481 RepID=UPI00351AA62B|nr:hypothetical protein LSM04_002556 [Trypanosoma melophagium]
MIWEAVSFLTLKVEPDVDRLRRISAFFFILWLVDLFLGIYCECLVLNVNALVVFNVWVSLVGAAISHHYSSSAVTPPQVVGTECLQRSPRGSNRVKARETSPSRVCGEAGKTDGFCFGLKRLYVLICFGAAVFVLFGCLAVIGESLQHALHPPDYSPLLLLTVGIMHILLFTHYAAEIDAYDHISGQPATPAVLRSCDTIITNASNSREKTAVRPTVAQALAKAKAAHKSLLKSLREAVSRAAAPIACVASSLIMCVGGRPLWGLLVFLLLTAHVAIRTVSSGSLMAALLLNNVLQRPEDIAACERALRAVRLIDGVLLLQSSIVWDVTPGERIALVELRLTSDADPTAVCAAARGVLTGIAKHVFVEARTTHEEDDDDDDNANTGSESFPSWSQQNQRHHSHSHAHSHSHHNGEKHDDDHHHGGCLGEREHLKGTNENLYDVSRSVGEVASSTSVNGETMFFPQPPKVSAADHTEQQTRLRGAAVGANIHTAKATKSFNFVPPPFPKPPA